LVRTRRSPVCELGFCHQWMGVRKDRVNAGAILH
jgi:hypothetical protein